MAIIFLYLALLAGAFFVLIVRPQRRQMAARRSLIASIEVGDEVITAGGIYGTVRELTDTTLLVEVAPGVTLTLAREAVSGRPPAPPTEIDLADADEDALDPPSGADEETAVGRQETAIEHSADRDLQNGADRDLGEGK
jgi:preprotein translocase subunit YajC